MYQLRLFGVGYPWVRGFGYQGERDLVYHRGGVAWLPGSEKTGQ